MLRQKSTEWNEWFAKYFEDGDLTRNRRSSALIETSREFPWQGLAEPGYLRLDAYVGRR